MHIAIHLTINAQSICKGDVSIDLRSVGNQTFNGGLFFFIKHGVFSDVVTT
jgi:hypothetical protein